MASDLRSKYNGRMTTRKLGRNGRLHLEAVDFDKSVLKKVSQFENEISTGNRQGAPCITVSSYRALVRVAGYFKYRSEGHVVFRGQTRCFGAMKASLHRRSPSPSDRVVDSFLARYRAALDIDKEPLEKIGTEPLLQHYGIDTRWLDVVDSLPHALFFSAHTLTDGQRPSTKTYVPSLEEFGYIYVLDVGHLKFHHIERKSVMGIYRTSNNLTVVDLRVVKPSRALRPHAQHGLLVRTFSEEKDLWPFVVARIAVPTQEARQWISASALSREALFPARVWDSIYERLLGQKTRDFLELERSKGRSWGNILRFDFAP